MQKFRSLPCAPGLRYSKDAVGTKSVETAWPWGENSRDGLPRVELVSAPGPLGPGDCQKVD